MEAKITLTVKYDKLVCFYSDQVMDLAMETMSSDHNVYFDAVPLTDRHDLLWSDELNGWELRYKTET